MRTAVIAAGVLGAVVVAGCGSSATPGAKPPSSPSTTPVAALRVQDGGAGICLQSVTVPTDFGYWRAVLTATQSLRITGVGVGAGADVTVHGGLALALTGSAVSAGIAHWPMSGPGELRHEVNWSARKGLIGVHLKAGQVVLPLIHVNAQPDGHLDTADVRYRTDAGLDGVAVMTESLRLSRETC
ncbi:MAG: hypothetical protein JWR52_817 [Marmoricola sp.]|nr:hypothetical protein [Marmoricola sp.]